MALSPLRLSAKWCLAPETGFLLALSLATAFLWVPALTLPLLRLENLGLDNHASLLGCIFALMHGLYLPAGLLLLFTLLIMPLANLVAVSRLLWALASTSRCRRHAGCGCIGRVGNGP